MNFKSVLRYIESGNLSDHHPTHIEYNFNPNAEFDIIFCKPKKLKYNWKDDAFVNEDFRKRVSNEIQNIILRSKLDTNKTCKNTAQNTINYILLITSCKKNLTIVLKLQEI